jgi:hypothetical protein
MEELLVVIEKVGKRKNWIGGKEGWGMTVRVVVTEEGWEEEGREKEGQEEEEEE